MEGITPSIIFIMQTKNGGALYERIRYQLDMEKSYYV